jgi:hypothetical protein
MRGQARFRAWYSGSKRYATWGFSVPTPKRDALSSAREPWYDSQNRNATGLAGFQTTNSTARVSLWDQPEVPVPKETPDEQGKLVRTEGKTSFTTWLIARKKSPPNTIQYLNWAAWEVDYGTTFKAGAGGSRLLDRVTGRTRGRGTGSGQGPYAPILRGQTANAAVKGAIRWL